MQYGICVITIIPLISYYYTIPYITSFYENYVMGSPMLYIHIFIIVISFTVLTSSFIFSDLKQLLHPSRESRLKVSLFLLPLALFVHINFGTWINSNYVYFHLYPGLENESYYKSDVSVNMLFEVLYMVYVCLWYPLMSYVVLRILYLLSAQIDIKEPDVATEANDGVLDAAFAV